MVSVGRLSSPGLGTASEPSGTGSVTASRAAALVHEDELEGMLLTCSSTVGWGGWSRLGNELADCGVGSFWAAVELSIEVARRGFDQTLHFNNRFSL